MERLACLSTFMLNALATFHQDHAWTSANTPSH
jgi:hypothetical protein